MSYPYPPPPTTDPYLTGPAPAPRPPLDGWSVASLVTAVLGLTPVGLVTSVVGLSRTSGGRRRGRGLAVAGLVVSVVLGLLQVVLVSALVSAWPQVRDAFVDGFEEAVQEDAVQEEAAQEEGEDTGTGTLDAFAVTVGTCFIEPEGETFVEVQSVPCDSPHDGEVLALVQLEDGPWPGDDEVVDLAYEACVEATGEVLAAAGVDGRDLDPWMFTPTRESWVFDGDREAACFVANLDGSPLTGPVVP